MPPPSASSVAPPSKARLPLPPTPPGIDPESFEVLASVCAVGLVNGNQVGCRSTPPFGPDEQPDGRVVEAGDPSELCLLDGFLRGSFSGEGKDQALLGLNAGPDRVNDISPGSIVLAERDASGWHVVGVESGSNLRGCKPSKRVGRTLLVCGDGFGAYGDGALWWSYTLDFAQPRDSRRHVFSKLFSTPGVYCITGVDRILEQGVTDWKMVSEHLGDSDGDGLDDYSMVIDRAHAPGSPALGKKFEALCKGVSPGGMKLLQQSVFLGKPTRITLQFKGDSSSLSPTAETARLLQEWRKQAPASWWDIR